MSIRNICTGAAIATTVATVGLLLSCSRGKEEAMSVWMARSEMVRQTEGDDLHTLGMRRVADKSGNAELRAFAWADVDRQISEPALMRRYLANTSVAFDENVDLFKRRAAEGDTLLHAWAIDNGRQLMAMVCLIADDETHASDSLKSNAQSLANALLKLRDGKDGLWRRILLSPKGDANDADPAASAMITYALLKGARTGVLPHEMAEAGREGLSHFTETFIQTTETTGDGRDLISVIDNTPDTINDTEATGAFLLSCLEVGL